MRTAKGHVDYVSGTSAVKLQGNYSVYKQEKLTHSKKEAVKSSGNTLYTIVFLFVIMATLAVSVLLLKAKFIVDDNSERAIELQQQLLDIKRENSRIQSKIDESIDIQQVYITATEELGMIQPTAEQIRYIQTEEVSYTVQYADITKEEKSEINIGNVLGIITKDW